MSSFTIHVVKTMSHFHLYNNCFELISHMLEIIRSYCHCS